MKPVRVLLAIAFVSMTNITGAQQPAPSLLDADPCAAHPRVSYEVATVKPSTEQPGHNSSHTTPDSLTATLSLRKLIRNAYDLREFQISGGPGWVDDAMWDIRAKTDAPEADPTKLDQTGRDAWADRRKQRLQSLLVDRFHLTCHFVTKQLPVYDMVLARGGPKLAQTTAPPERQHSVNSNGDSRKIDMSVRGVTMTEAAVALSGEVERIVVDKTGLTGNYDFHLSFATENARAQDTDAASLPTLFTALEEQLGLKLIPSKGPVKVLVIDSVEKPSEN